MVCLRHHTCGQPGGSVSLSVVVFAGRARTWPADLDVYRDATAGDVYFLFLCDDLHSHERLVHADRKHAWLGAGHQQAESGYLFHRRDADGGSEGEWSPAHSAAYWCRHSV